MGNYSRLLYSSSTLDHLYLNTTKETELVLGWIASFLYKDIDEYYNIEQLSVAKIFKDLDDTKMFGYMDQSMINFFNNLVNAIDWKQVTEGIYCIFRIRME